ncbi:MAG: 4Fe-4S binding protein [Deltaproteobacteria bacterium]|nr:4Fe-4S binding protein [Deltaproteobacteria bacterium]
MRDRGLPAWLLSAGLFAFYLVLYFTSWLDPVGRAVWPRGDKWSLYGILYTVAVLLGGALFIRRNRRSRYQVIRTTVIMLVQLLLAFLIPAWMRLLSGRDFYFSYLWPLKIEYFYPETIFSYPLPFVLWSFLGALVLAPLLAFLLGKRWYCSWVCGCGGLANTAGDPFRHLSSKRRWAWRLETVSIHLVLVLALVTTALVLVNWGVGKEHPRFAQLAFRVQAFYGFAIGALFSGMLGVGLYPLLGTRVWCRFGCPMAAILGLTQRVGRFRIATQKELCIGCGNCSHACEMGIDVRAYAMRGEEIRRASCVGCGICAHVCPRGVLRLENRKGGAP